MPIVDLAVIFAVEVAAKLTNHPLTVPYDFTLTLQQLCDFPLRLGKALTESVGVGVTSNKPKCAWVELGDLGCGKDIFLERAREDVLSRVRGPHLRHAPPDHHVAEVVCKADGVVLQMSGSDHVKVRED